MNVFIVSDQTCAARLYIESKAMISSLRLGLSRLSVASRAPVCAARFSSLAEGVAVEDAVKEWPAPEIDEKGRSYGTGRRKTSVARVWVKEGTGAITVNDRRFVEYFQPLQRFDIVDVFVASGTAGKFDVWCTVKGGGVTGQAGAVRLGIARALEKYSPDLRPALSSAAMLTRDPRRVERKKPGQKKARKKFQWVKR